MSSSGLVTYALVAAALGVGGIMLTSESETPMSDALEDITDAAEDIADSINEGLGF